MIKTREEMHEYLIADAKKRGCEWEGRIKREIFITFLSLGKEVAKFEIALRFLEYYGNKHDAPTSHLLSRLIISFPYLFWRFVYHKLSVKCGFDICANSFGKGLYIHHRGTVVVNKYARIGDFCDVLPGVVIGQNGTSDDVPQIGNHVYIGAGAKIIGKIRIADGIAIGANAVVNKSFSEEGIAIAGVPARKVGVRKNLE